MHHHCGEVNIHLGLLFTRSMPDFAIWMILLKCMVQILARIGSVIYLRIGVLYSGMDYAEGK